MEERNIKKEKIIEYVKTLEPIKRYEFLKNVFEIMLTGNRELLKEKLEISDNYISNIRRSILEIVRHPKLLASSPQEMTKLENELLEKLGEPINEFGIFELVENELIEEKRNKELKELLENESYGSVRFINKLKKIIRYDADAKRSMVLKRDDNKCQLCDSYEDLEVHHIISVDDYIGFLFSQLDKNSMKDSLTFIKWYSKTTINHLYNLISVCKTCHKGIIPSIRIKLINIAIDKTRKLPRQTTIPQFS